MKPDADTHQNHRRRMRNRIRQTGLESLADHEVLEVLLYYALPRKDTNSLAHRLLRHYGSLAGVLDADPADLARQEGIGENAAFLLHFAAGLSARYLQDKNRRKPVFGSTVAFVNYARGLFAAEVREVAYLLGLDKGLHLICTVKLAEGTVDGVSFALADLLRQAVSHSFKNVVLAHNHPGGSSKPSLEDFDLTRHCLAVLDSSDIRLVDHLIIAGDAYFSFQAQGYIDIMYKDWRRLREKSGKIGDLD